MGKERQFGGVYLHWGSLRVGASRGQSDHSAERSSPQSRQASGTRLPHSCSLCVLALDRLFFIEPLVSLFCVKGILFVRFIDFILAE